MVLYHKYLIGESDLFDPLKFVQLNTDLALIHTGTSSVSPDHCADMVLSFLNRRAIKMEWTDANPELALMIHSGSLPFGDIQALFHSCRNHPAFKKELEKYIRIRLS
jgi:hypothetical protein